MLDGIVFIGWVNCDKEKDILERYLEDESI